LLSTATAAAPLAALSLPCLRLRLSLLYLLVLLRLLLITLGLVRSTASAVPAGAPGGPLALPVTLGLLLASLPGVAGRFLPLCLLLFLVGSLLDLRVLCVVGSTATPSPLSARLRALLAVSRCLLVVVVIVQKEMLL
jgi:hypothetical protein